jgi:AhpD family alkylhydroperoxidase
MSYNVAAAGRMKALGAACGCIRPPGLPSRLIDLVLLRVSQINNCPYCIDLHSRDLIDGGLPLEHLVLVSTWSESREVFSEQERAALAWAEDVTRLGERGVRESTFEAAAAAFDEQQLVDLTLAVALMNAYARIAITFRGTRMALVG